MKKLPYDIERKFTEIFQYISDYMGNVFYEGHEHIQKDLRIMLKSLRKIIVEYFDNNCITRENMPKPSAIKEQENSPVLKQHPVDRWIPYGDPDWNAWQCSACGAVQYLESGTPLENEWLCCPHCGKRLNEEMTRERHEEVY